MVDALEEIHRLLRGSGTLIEIHPVHGAWIEVRSGADVAFVEADPGFDSDDDLRPTAEALSAIVRRGRFVIERSQEFDFLTYFECEDEGVAVFDQVLLALRDFHQNPEWRYVQEGPIWRGKRVLRW